jgi:predicted nucleotidyltransferase
MERLRDLVKEERKEIKEVLSNCLEKEEPILFAYLHGSFAEERPFRDIDIAVFVDESRISKERALDLEMSISLRLEKIIKMPIDVKIINYAPLAFQFYSTAGRLLICNEDDLRVDFLTTMRSIYFDFKFSMEKCRRDMH